MEENESGGQVKTVLKYYCLRIALDSLKVNLHISYASYFAKAILVSALIVLVLPLDYCQ